MTDEVFTLGAWWVKERMEAEFIAAWRGVGHHFRDLPEPSGQGTLVQDVDDPHQFLAQASSTSSLPTALRCASPCASRRR